MLFNRFFDNMTLQYSDIYVRTLGADPVQVGLVNSAGGIGSGIMSIPIGWLQDRYSLKKIFIFGLSLFALSSLLYASASSWLIIAPAIFLTNFATRVGGCMTICDICLKNEDRATGKALCEGAGSIPSLLAPTIAALILVYFGGVGVTGISSLYWIQFVARVILLVFTAKRMTEIIRLSPTNGGRALGFLKDMREVFTRGVATKRWIVFSSLGQFVIYWATPFRYVFAHEIKKADQFVIGYMATAKVLGIVLFSIPLGRISDSAGRKKVFYFTVPLFCLSYILLVLAPTFEFLVIASLLEAFEQISLYVVSGSMGPELVPIDCVGRWRGILGLFTSVAMTVAPVAAGLVWNTIGPFYVFLIPIAISLLIRVPVLITIPETLKRAGSS